MPFPRRNPHPESLLPSSRHFHGHPLRARPKLRHTECTGCRFPVATFIRKVTCPSSRHFQGHPLRIRPKLRHSERTGQRFPVATFIRGIPRPSSRHFHGHPLRALPKLRYSECTSGRAAGVAAPLVEEGGDVAWERGVEVHHFFGARVHEA